MMEIKVKSSERNKIFFKTSHLDEAYDCTELKRGITIDKVKVNSLYTLPINIKLTKYKNLISLCNGANPIIRLPEMKDFYESSLHDSI